MRLKTYLISNNPLFCVLSQSATVQLVLIHQTPMSSMPSSCPMLPNVFSSSHVTYSTDTARFQRRHWPSKMTSSRISRKSLTHCSGSTAVTYFWLQMASNLFVYILIEGGTCNSALGNNEWRYKIYQHMSPCIKWWFEFEFFLLMRYDEGQLVLWRDVFQTLQFFFFIPKTTHWSINLQSTYFIAGSPKWPPFGNLETELVELLIKLLSCSYISFFALLLCSFEIKLSPADVDNWWQRDKYHSSWDGTKCCQSQFVSDQIPQNIIV